MDREVFPENRTERYKLKNSLHLQKRNFCHYGPSRWYIMLCYLCIFSPFLLFLNENFIVAILFFFHHCILLALLHVLSLNCVRLFVTTWTAALQATALCPWDFSRQNYCNGLPFPAPGSSWPRDQTHISCICIGRWILYHWATWEAHIACLWVTIFS